MTGQVERGLVARLGGPYPFRESLEAVFHLSMSSHQHSEGGNLTNGGSTFTS